MKKYAIIVAGGIGTRMNSSMPKQFMEIAGKPLLVYTIERFYHADPSTTIIVVLPESNISEWEVLDKKSHTKVPYTIVPGGAVRFESVKKGLELVIENSIVAVHDGVRPLVSAALINKCFDGAEKLGNTIPVVPLNESLRLVTGEKSEVADRAKYVNVQTPQCFRSEILLNAYQQPFKDSFTDDASVVESIGEQIHMIEGERENIKVTYPADLLIAEAFLIRGKK